jgi:cyclophilin family peptidyl-prolyl cis-trans isomerase
VGTDKRNRQKQNRAAAREARARQQRRDTVKNRTLKWGGLVAVIVIALFAVSRLDSSDSSGSTDTTAAVSSSSDDATTLTTLPGEAITGDTPCPKTDGSEKRVTSFEKAPSMCIDAAKSYTATFDTSEGVVEVALDTERTPNTVNNFVVLSRYKYYDGSYIFRTDPSIDIIQGGGATNSDDPGYSIKDEGTGFVYEEGDLVMARTGAPDSAGGQFFFVTGENAALLNSQGTYVTFGRISKGLDVVKKIIGLNSGSGDLGGAPSRPVEITTVSITEK